MGLLNPGGPIAQFKRNRCSISPVELISRSGVRNMYLKDRPNSAGSCWPGIKTIAKDLNLSRSPVKRALADLEQHGYLAKLPRYRPNGSNTSNLYTLK